MSSESLALLTQLTARKLVPGRYQGLEQRRRLSLTVALRPCAGYVQPSRIMPDDRGKVGIFPEPAVGRHVTPGSGGSRGRCTRRLTRTGNAPMRWLT